MRAVLDEMGYLVDGLKIKEETVINDARNRSILADWVTDHPNLVAELVGELLRSAPDIVGTMLSAHLTMELEERVSGIRLTEISLKWDGLKITSIVLVNS
jgi:hypothetical protein